MRTLLFGSPEYMYLGEMGHVINANRLIYQHSYVHIFKGETFYEFLTYNPSTASGCLIQLRMLILETDEVWILAQIFIIAFHSDTWYSPHIMETWNKAVTT